MFFSSYYYSLTRKKIYIYIKKKLIDMQFDTGGLGFFLHHSHTKIFAFEHFLFLFYRVTFDIEFDFNGYNRNEEKKPYKSTHINCFLFPY